MSGQEENEKKTSDGLVRGEEEEIVRGVLKEALSVLDKTLI